MWFGVNVEKSSCPSWYPWNGTCHCSCHDPFRVLPSRRLHSTRTSKGERDGEGRGEREVGQKDTRGICFLFSFACTKRWPPPTPTPGFPLLRAWLPCQPSRQRIKEWAHCSEMSSFSFAMSLKLYGCALHAQSMFSTEIFNQHLIQIEKQPLASCQAYSPWHWVTSRASGDLLEDVTPAPAWHTAAMAMVPARALGSIKVSDLGTVGIVVSPNLSHLLQGEILPGLIICIPHSWVWRL